MMGQGTKIFTTLNLLSPAIADYLLLRRYGRILKKYFG
ncbi:Short-chain dehydrogenase/reductase SDR [Streptococcus oralis]|uniref:Short-chain dehydrogenase/reductase SDR n=1 Tax=Streptococcus oralis TaxID=1303 RepID=A0A139PRE0_STROR|nr:Short-chain dehydrogenase/reductase SDR [Streptococcus oralis]